MKLYLRLDLFKNIVTIDGQKYDVRDDAADGYEAYQATDGSTKYRKLVGQGAPSEQPEGKESQVGATDKDSTEAPTSNDPLADPKQQQKEPKASPEEAKKLAEEPPDVKQLGEMAAKKPQVATPEGKPQLKPTPFTMDADAHKDTTALEHFHAANIADKLGDKKMAQFHRDQAGGKLGDHPDDIYVLQEHLKEAGYHEDADSLEGTRREKLSSKVDQKAATREKQQEMDHLQEKTGIPAYMREKAADEKHEDLKEQYNKTGPALEQHQKEAQGKAKKLFDEKTKEFEDAQFTHESELASYEAELEDHLAAKQEYTQKLDAINEKLKAVKEGKPIRDDSEEQEHLKKYNETQKELRDHNKKKPDGSKVKEAQKKLRDFKEQAPSDEEYKAAKADYEKASAEHKKQGDKLKQQLDKIKASAPAKPKNKADLASYEARSKEHARKVSEAEKELASHEKQAPSKSKVDKAKAAHTKKKDEHKKKLSALKAQVATIKDAHDAELKAHTEKAKELQDKADKQQDDYKKTKEASRKDHNERLDSWNEEMATVEEERAEHKKEAKEVPKAPKKPKVKEPKQTHKEPESREEKMAHEDHTKAATKLADQIRSHIENRSDITPEQKERMTQLHEQATELGAQIHTPTPEDRKALRELASRAKEHGAHEHHDDYKAKQEATQAKEQAKQQKEQAKQARPPQNEMEEAQLNEHKNKMQEQADLLQAKLESDPELSDEDKKHLQSAIEHYTNEAQRDTLPGQDESKKTKEFDKLMGRHIKDAKTPKEGGEAPAPKQEKPVSEQSARARGTSLLQAYNRGGAFGAKMAHSAYSPYGGGETASLVDYAGSGALRAGHKLLGPKRGGGSSSDKPKEDLRETKKDTVDEKREALESVVSRRTGSNP